MKLLVEQKEVLAQLGRTYEGHVLLGILEAEHKSVRKLQDSALDLHQLFRAQGRSLLLSEIINHLKGDSA